MGLFHADTFCGCASLTTGSKIIAWFFMILDILGLSGGMFYEFMRKTLAVCNSVDKGDCGLTILVEGMLLFGYCGVFGFGIFISYLVLAGLRQNRYILLLPWIVVQCGSLVAMISFLPYLITAFSIIESWSVLVVVLLVIPVVSVILYHWISVVYTTMVQMGNGWSCMGKL